MQPKISTVFSKPILNKRQVLGLKYFLIALPIMILVFLFAYVPLFGWVYAFTNYQPGMRFMDMQFTGLKNFAKLFTQNSEILRVMRNTFVMSGLGLACSFLPVLFAIMLNEVKNNKFKRLVQTTTTLPNFISWIVIYGLAFAMFSNSGLMNTVFTKLSIPVPKINLLGNNNAIWFFELGMGIWKSLGWSAIIYIAAIAGIDVELYDAAEVDGVNKVQAAWHITLPGIMPTFLVLFLLGISNLLNNGLEQYFVFYNSMVADKIEVLDYYVYKVGILIGDYPYSVAIGMLKSIISITLLFGVNYASKRVRGESLI